MGYTLKGIFLQMVVIFWFVFVKTCKFIKKKKKKKVHISRYGLSGKRNSYVFLVKETGNRFIKFIFCHFIS
jgi:hypothetical protein